jgi:predicted LPLAT superfamily acyltransferase
MTEKWAFQSERGSVWLMLLYVKFILRVGRGPSRAILHLICLYYFLLFGRARRASFQFLSNALGSPPGWKDVYRHFYTFSATILDRVLFLSGRTQDFDVQIHGGDLILDMIKRKQGCLLLGSHLGSFEVARMLDSPVGNIPLKVLMHEENAYKVTRVVNSINPEIAQSVIPIGAPGSLIRVRECLQKGDLVGILGDRHLSAKKSVRCRFLGEEAVFPAGPFLLASMLKVPVILFFGLYLGGNRYAVHFEMLAERVELAPAEQEEGLREWVERYVRRLEFFCRTAPYNWFNFYDYWDA